MTETLRRSSSRQGRVEERIGRRLAEGGILRVASFPSRGGVDKTTGETFLGLPNDRLKEQILSDPLLLPLRNRESYMPAGAQIRSLPADFYAKRDHFFSNTINDDILSSGTTDVARAVDSGHQKDKSTINRILGDNAVDERVLAPASVKDNHINGRLGRTSVPRLQDLEGEAGPGQVPGINGLRDRLNSETKIDWRKGSVPKSAVSGVDWDKVDGKPPIVNPGALDALEARMRKWATARFAAKGHRHN